MMDLDHPLIKRLSKLNPRLVAFIERQLRHSSKVRSEISKEQDKIMAELERSVKPYAADFERHLSLPEAGIERDRILEEMQEISGRERGRWQAGYVSGAVYHGDESHIDFLNQVYAIHSQSNPLHSDLFPSASKYEAEIVSMTAKMLGAEEADDESAEWSHRVVPRASSSP